MARPAPPEASLPDEATRPQVEPPLAPVRDAPAPAPERDTVPNRTVLARVRAFRSRHARWETAVLFCAGFVLDALTLGRADSRAVLLKQGVQLGVLGLALVLEPWAARGQGARPRWHAALQRGLEGVAHLLLGGLLSAFTLFYFKSSSGLTSLGFMAVLVALLLGNESRRVRRLGPVVRLCLFALCVASYLAYLLPVVAGWLGPELFALAAAGGAAAVLPVALAWRGWGGRSRAATARALGLGLAVPLALAGLYYAHAIPPAPLAVEQLGVYHAVEREGASVRLLADGSAWRSWLTGDAVFRARPGDRLWAFVRIWAPAGFADRVVVRFSVRDPRRGWVDRDRVPLTISGGRAEGFRGWAYKAHYEPGRWRITVETADGREVGRREVDIVADEGTGPRAFRVEQG